MIIGGKEVERDDTCNKELISTLLVGAISGNFLCLCLSFSVFDLIMKLVMTGPC